MAPRAKTMWKKTSADYMFKSRSPSLDVKAFILFYRNALWPDRERECFNSMKVGGENQHFLKENYAWNIESAVMSKKSLAEWFPKAIFPLGPFYDDATIIFSSKFRACLDLLVEHCFKKPKLILKKTTMGLGWFADDQNTEGALISMKDDVIPNAKGYLCFLTIYEKYLYNK
jgi:hypothetical protein